LLKVATRSAALSALSVLLLLGLNSLGSARAQEPPTITPEPASLVLGQPNFYSSAAAPGPNGLSQPEFAAFDKSGDLWVSDYGNSYVVEYKPPFTFNESASVEVGSPSFAANGCDNTGLDYVCSPNGIAFDPSGNLWVADSQNDSIVEFKAPLTIGENVSTIIGEPSAGTVNASNLGEVGGIAFDSSGNLWVADQSDNRVVEFKAPLSTGEPASLVLGQSSLTGTSDNLANANMSGPEDMAFDQSGNLWVADTDNSRIMEFAHPFSDGEAASLVIGAPDFTSYGGNDTQSTVTLPEAIAFDHSGDLWVSDSGNSRVLEFATPLSTGENASRLIGQYSYFFGGPNATQTQLGYPEGLAFDSSGNLWVSDPGYARVLEYANPLTYQGSSSTTSASSSTTTSSTTIVTSSSTSTTTSTSVITTSIGGPTTSVTATTSSKSGGGVPVFPYQLALAAAFTALLVASYLLIRRRTLPHGHVPSGRTL
jgi:sugar lactone lactonase YvrE